MTEHTVTENYGSEICQESLVKMEQKLQRRTGNAKIVERDHCCIIWATGNNLMDKIKNKINDYLSSTENVNEYILGFILDTKTSGGPMLTRLAHESYLITNYGNIYRFNYSKKFTENELLKDENILIPGKIGYYDYYEGRYDLYVKLWKVVTINQKLFDFEIDKIKDNILLTNFSTNGDNSHSLIYNPYNSSEKNYVEKNNLIEIIFQRNESNGQQINNNYSLIRLENWKTIVNNHIHIILARNIVLEEPIDNNSNEPEPIDNSNEPEPIDNSNEPPDNFRCPITTEVMDEPVVAMDGHTYERLAIETWFLGHNISPMTGLMIENKTTLIPNFTLRSLITSWN